MYEEPPPWWDPFGDTRYLVWNGQYMPHMFATELTLPSFAGELGSPNGHVGAVDAGAFNRKAFDKVLTQIPTSVSIMNFLWELRDVKSLLKRSQGFLTNLAHVHLWWNFAALPLISDIMKLLTVIPDVLKRLEHLQRINQRTVTISHVDTFVLHDDDSPPPFDPGIVANGSGTDNLVPQLEYHSCQLRVNMQVYTDINLNGADTFLRAMYAALGLTSPQKIIWNAIPFSFIVDWLIDVDSWLDTYAHQPFEGTIDIRGVSGSAKAKRFYGCWSPTSPTSWAKVSTGLVSSYHRFTGVPEGTLWTDGLTPHQLTLVAALLQTFSARNYRTRV